MKKIRDFSSRYPHFYLLLLLIPIQIWFQYSELTLAPVYFTQTGLDEKIPFLKAFVVPYLLWFAFVPYGVVYIGLHSKKDFYKLFLFLFGGMAVSNLAFTVFPNAQSLRPPLSSDDPFSLLLKMVYFVDTPTDVCPSMHVINSIAVDAALQHSRAFSAGRFRKAAAHILTVLICLSTVFVKQHAVLDVICGAVVSALLYIPLYLLPARRIGSRRRSGRVENAGIQAGEIGAKRETGHP